MDYNHSMDRAYFKQGTNYGLAMETTEGVSDIQFGISAPPFDNQLQSLKARIRQGATHVELGFTGTGKGSMGGRSTTPEMYGKDEREAIKELAKINKVELSTHATVGMTGLSGFSERGFNQERAEQTITELRRAIDFAADTARGGPVVVHTGEWQRPVSQAAKEFEQSVPSYEEGKKKPMFLGHPEEDEKGVVMVAREDTGDVQAIPKNFKVHEPEKEIVKDENGNDIVKGYKVDEFGKVKLRTLNFDQAVAEMREEHPEMKDVADEVLWIRKYFDASREQHEAESARFLEASQHDRKILGKLEERKKYYEKRFENAHDEEEKNVIAGKMVAEFGKRAEDFEGYENTPSEFMEKQLQEAKRKVEWEEKAALSYAKQAEQEKERQDNQTTIHEVGIKRSADTLARAALYAYDETKMKKLEKPLFIAPEAWLPEQWGSHPKEIIELVTKGREKLAEYLHKERGLSEEDAAKESQKHVSATLDIGHMNMWRKFLQPKPGENREQADKRFDEWLVKHAKELAKEGVVGHIHVTDNFGYQDEHVTPGEGNAPIKKFIEEIQKEMQKQGKKVDFIVEPAHQDIEALKGTWKMMGTNVYGLGSWGNIQNSYFGHNQPPYFAIPDMLGIQREWNSSYFGIPFE
ncbi:hypothetical protein HY483_01075 [Candidatus Woesearchaeota archaeon]|nr:hypothetical protein [Candidatus Woesearchaeota archaeon]